MSKKEVFYFSERDFLNKKFPNISVLNVRDEHKNGGRNATIIFTCQCLQCGKIFEITRKNLAKIAKECNSRAKRKRVTCETMFRDVLFCNHSAYIGKKYNHLTIKEFVDEKPVSGRSCVVCECDCGNKTRADGTPLVFEIGNVRSGMTKSCGCIRSEAAKRCSSRPLKDSGTHKTKERLYTVWTSMIARCYNPNRKEYPIYGGRGITVCNSWREDYIKFRKWALANGYDANAPRGMCTLDRIDNNKGYKPSNCRWTDVCSQNKNKVNTLVYSYYSHKMTARGWSEYLDIDYQELLTMLYQGMSIGQIIKKHKLQNTDFKE